MGAENSKGVQQDTTEAQKAQEEAEKALQELADISVENFIEGKRVNAKHRETDHEKESSEEI